MRPGPGIRRLLRLPARPRGDERDVDAELAFHIETRAEALARGGLTREEARRRALAEFGDVGAARRELASLGRARRGRAR